MDQEALAEREHDFMDSAKTQSFQWDAVETMSRETPDLIDVQPSGRGAALHQAAFEGNRSGPKELLDLGANPSSLNSAGETPADVAMGSAKEVLAAPCGSDAMEEAAGEAAAGEASLRVEPPVDVAVPVEPPGEAAVPVEPPGEAAVPAEPLAEKAGSKEAAVPLETPLKKARARKAAVTVEPPAKKAKKEKVVVYQMNINEAVDKEYEHSSFSEISKAPTSALQGIAGRGRDVLKKFGVKTVRDLGKWKFYRMAKAISGLSKLEAPGNRWEGSALNANRALDKAHECKSLKDILKLPPSALQGLAGWADDELAKLHIKTIAALGEWKFARWAEWITELAEFEE